MRVRVCMRYIFSIFREEKKTPTVIIIHHRSPFSALKYERQASHKVRERQSTLKQAKGRQTPMGIAQKSKSI
jgi:hypothetical protein